MNPDLAELLARNRETCPPPPPPPLPWRERLRLKVEAEWKEKRAALTMLLDATDAVMTRREFDSLDEYSTSLPSGVYAGKIWKCHLGAFARRMNPSLPAPIWKLVEYVDDGDPESMAIHWRIIHLTDGELPT